MCFFLQMLLIVFGHMPNLTVTVTAMADLSKLFNSFSLRNNFVIGDIFIIFSSDISILI